ncbi:hypothetical protein [Phenylobacterium sp.]|uniref:hypothetical protein n=1 Tax=Phenylobacterium sp. TaxID=1871053 RepID=UPI002BCAB063|nr:hypothetical protein [Phenylobacterium sp.]HLZ76530.1 hypothetical protein [Phenylobacterium sp.]
MAKPDILVKAVACLFLASLCACRAKVDQRVSQQAVSINPVCALDVEKASHLTEHGDLASARKLRGYYWDCVREGYDLPLKNWALVAARIGDKSDQKEYMKVLAEGRFETEGMEWESPASCSGDEDIRTYRPKFERDLVGAHKRMAFYIFCEEAGISPNIMSLAKRTAKIGSAADKRFYSDLVEVKSEPSR